MSGNTSASMRKGLGGIMQIVLSVALKAGAAVLALGVQWLVARQFGPAGTGQFAILATTSTLIGIVCLFGQDYIALRNVASDLAVGHEVAAAAKARLSVRIVLAGCVLATILILAIALVSLWWLNDRQLAINFLLVLPVCWGVSLGRVYSFIARASGSLVPSQLADGPINSGTSLLFFGALFLLAVPPSTLWIGAVYGASYAAALLYAWQLYRQRIAIWTGDGEAGLTTRDLLISGFPLVVMNTLPYASDWIIITAVTWFHSTATAGLVRIVTMVLTVMYLVTIAFDAALSQQMTAAIKLGDARRARHLYGNYILGSLAFNAPLLFIAVLFPRFLLGIFGPEYIAAAETLRIGVLIQVVTVALGPAGLYLVLSSNERLSLWVNLAGLATCLVFAAMVIPQVGLLGGVLAFAITLLLKRVAEVMFLATRIPDLSIFRRGMHRP